jgi:tetratricopeptide (TPR) repeat protein
MKTISILAALSMHPGFFACLNSPSMVQSLNGWTSVGHNLSYHLSHAMDRAPEDKQPRLSDRADPQDAAVTAILRGDHAKGIAMLKELETTKPGDYNTAANLGTAFELSGDNEKALNWIKEGIRRNPRSHQGTEWLHALILEAKLTTGTGNALPETNRLVPLPEKVEKDTVLTIQGAEHKAADVFTALAYQLEERMTFVKPKDRWVSECLYSLAILQAHFYSIQDALRILALAEQYGFPDVEQLRSQRQQFERSIWIGEVQYWGLIVVGSLAGISAIIYCYRKLADLLS